jgi:hypothetical protein
VRRGGHGREEAADRRGSVVFERLGWHGQQRVVAEQRDDAVDVARLERCREAVDELALRPRARQRRMLAPARRGDRFECLARALERSVHGDFGDAEHLGDLAGVEGEHVAQDEYGALSRRESLQAGDECKSDRFSRFVASFGLL